MKNTRKFVTINIIISIVLIILFFNEYKSYQNQSELIMQKLSNEIANEIDDLDNLVLGIQNNGSKEIIESNFNNLLMDISNVEVLLTVSRNGKGLSQEELTAMLEVLNFHQYLVQEIQTISFQYSKNELLTESQVSDLNTLKNLFFDFRSSSLEVNGHYDTFASTIRSYNEQFSDASLLSSYFDVIQ